MKKAISVVLSCCILLASIATVMFGSVLAADPQTTSTYYDDAANWKIYSKDNTIGGVASTPGSNHAITAHSTIVHPDDTGSSLKIYAHGDVPSVALQGLEVGKKYVLSFYYHVPDYSKAASIAAWMDMIGIYKADSATVANNGKITCNNPVAGGPLTKAGEVEAGTMGDAQWHQHTMNFEVTEETGTDLHFAFRTWYAAGYVIYLDGFEVEEDKGWSQYYEYYDDVTNWKIYSKDNTIGGVASTPGSNHAITAHSTIVHPEHQGTSLKMYTHGDVPSIALQGLEVGKKYDLSFYYHVPDYTKAASIAAWMDMIGIYKADSATVANNGKITCSNPVAGGPAVKAGLVEAGTMGDAQWYQHTMTFAVTEETGTDLHFAFRAWYAAGYVIYLDGFDVVESQGGSAYYNNANNWKIYSPNDIVGGTASKPANDHEIKADTTIFAPEDPGSSLKVYANGDVPGIALQGLEVGKTYKISFQYYVPAYTVSCSAAFWMDAVGVYKKGTATVVDQGKITCSDLPAAGGPTTRVGDTTGHAPGDETWYSHSMSFIVTEETGTDLYFAFRTWYLDGFVIYLDDFSLVESNEDVFEGWGKKARDEYVINFDDFPVKYDIPDTIVVEDAPERDGKVSKATHILEGDWDKNIMPNFNASVQGVDPVFNMPVEPNTKYSLSFWVYVEKGKELPYFGLYFDYFSDSMNPGANTVLSTSNTTMAKDETGVWHKYEGRYTTRADQKVLKMVFNAGTKTVNMWIDDITVKKLLPGSIQAVEENYCQNAFNIILEDEAVAKDILAAKSGVYKFAVPEYCDMIFGMTVSSKDKNSKSQAYLSFDGTAAMALSAEGAPEAKVTAANANGRIGLEFFSSDSGFVYLVIENDDGALSIQDPCIFRKAPIQSSRVLGYKENPNISFDSANPIGSLREISVHGRESSGSASSSTQADSDDSLDSPQTGSVPVWPICGITFAALIACATLLRRKKGEATE